MESPRGDSPGDVLIVIALLLIMVATAIPNLLRAVLADHESSAVSTISGPTRGGRSSARE
jgi:Tfp pilus assembly protein FimT